MANEKIKQLTFKEENNPGILDVANRLAELEQRRPHDSIRLLILEAGKDKIAQLEEESKEKKENFT